MSPMNPVGPRSGAEPDTTMTTAMTTTNRKEGFGLLKSLRFTFFALTLAVYCAAMASVLLGRIELSPTLGLDTYEVPPAQLTRLVPVEFYDMAERDYPAEFLEHFGEASIESYHRAWREGRNVYVLEGCFHCHTQNVRETGPDIERWGMPIASTARDVRLSGVPMPGMRRIGPDLTFESNRRSNDWHAAHLYQPRNIVANSIMPVYPWLFDAHPDGRPIPNREGLALIVYLQSLGAEADRDNR